MAPQVPLRIVPLGGLGEFGLNCMIIESPDDAVVIDCGLMFPEDHMLGIDRVIPDVSYLHSLGKKVKGFVLTHGHEDHLGALPYVLPQIDAPVWATPFTAELLRRKLEEYPAAAAARIEEFEPGTPWRVGRFDIEGMHVTHSFVDACAIAIRAGTSTVVHSGDFKIDNNPVDGRRTDLDRLRELGDEGVTLLMSDSTNVERRGRTKSESEVRGYLEPIFEKTEGRLIVTTFASHLHRVAAIISLCEQYGRRIALLGRSMENNVSIATRTGHIRIPGELLVSRREAEKLPGREVCIIATGCQGEPRSALTRIATLEMRGLALGPGDAAVFSSNVIPGNERAISAVISQLYKSGAEVYYQAIRDVHVSGHGAREDLREMLEAVRPRYFVPLHGEYRNLTHHARLAVECGVSEQDCFRLVDGDVLEIDASGARRAGTVTAGRILVDGESVGEVDATVLRDRRYISEDGVVLVILAVSQQTGEILSGPELVTRGIAQAEQEWGEMSGGARAVVDLVGEMTPEAIADLAELQEKVRLCVRRYFRRTYNARPVVVPYVMEL